MTWNLSAEHAFSLRDRASVEQINGGAGSPSFHHVDDAPGELVERVLGSGRQ